MSRHLTDVYAMLIKGEIDQPALKAAAEKVGLFYNGRPDAIVLTQEMMDQYLPTIEGVAEIVKAYHAGKLDAIGKLLENTTSGKQGVPTANKMMHFWRYMRRAIGKEMYTCGFFKDHIPETGQITIFFENDIEALNSLLQ